MEKIRAGRNRTLTLSKSEMDEFQLDLHHIVDSASLADVDCRIINQNLFDVAHLLPRNFIDLLVLDPPYNLDKNFNGYKFSKSSDVEYGDYLRSWVTLILPLLKPTASVYFCCDWKNTATVYEVVSEYFTVRNRITWQREKGRGALSNWKN